MPKLSHEALVHLIRSAPEVVVELLRSSLGLKMPVNLKPRVTATELVDINFAEYRADLVLTLGEPVEEVFIVEAQGERDAKKRLSWPMYVAGTRVRWRCPVTLVVLAPNAKVAAWCRKPIDLGRGRCVLRPLVLGTRQIPRVTDEAVARASPELALLSLAVHGQAAGADKVAKAALSAIRSLDKERSVLYPELLYALVGKVARMSLDSFMENFNPRTYKPVSPWLRAYWHEYQPKFIAIHDKVDELVELGMSKEAARRQALEWMDFQEACELMGQLKGQMGLLLRMLRQRKFRVTKAVEKRVMACRDGDELMRWADRVLTAKTLGEVFAGDSSAQ